VLPHIYREVTNPLTMNFNEFLRDNRKKILKKWIDDTVATYPEEARQFMTSRSDRFANPVGGTISGGFDAVYDCLVQKGDFESEEVLKCIDGVVRIRAVQNFTAAQAVGFVYNLKQIVRKALGDQAKDVAVIDDLVAFEHEIDKLALLTFDIYMQCRERIYEMRANEIRNRTSRILQRAVQVWEKQGGGESDPRSVE
jgi:hypothetical protein